MLGPDFDANHCKVFSSSTIVGVYILTTLLFIPGKKHEFTSLFQMIGASDEQLDVFNELWYSMLLSTGQATKGMISPFCFSKTL